MPFHYFFSIKLTHSSGPRGQNVSTPSSGGRQDGPSTPRGPGSGSSQPGSDGRPGANLFGILRGSPSDKKGKGPMGGSSGAA